RLVRRHAAAKQRLAGAPVAAVVGGEEVHARKTVHLEVDESRRRDPVGVAGVQPDGGDEPVNHFDVARDEVPVDERCPDSETHRYTTTPAATGTETTGIATPVSRSKKCSSRGSTATSTASPGERRRCRSKRPRSVTDRSRSSTPREGPGGWAAASTRSARSS